MTLNNEKVVYFFDETEGNYYYGQGHPMKPHRMRMAHDLVLNYGLYNQMQIYVRFSDLLLFCCLRIRVSLFLLVYILLLGWVLFCLCCFPLPIQPHCAPPPRVFSPPPILL
jgi:hypothetical protein